MIYEMSAECSMRDERGGSDENYEGLKRWLIVWVRIRWIIDEG